MTAGRRFVPLPHALPLRTDEAAFGLRSQRVATPVGEVEVHVGRSVGATATVLLHGAAGRWTTWTPLLTAAEAAGASLDDLVIPDLPGWGASGELTADDVEDASDAVVATVRAAGYSSWRIVGHSLGGFLALDIAARYPRETAGVVLVSASGEGVVDATRRPLRGGIRLPAFAGMLLTMRSLAGLGAVGDAIVRSVARCGLLPLLTASLFARPVHPSVIEAFATEVRPRSFARAARLAADYEPRTWTAIECPVRSVRGTHDVFAGECDAALFATLIRRFRERRLPDAGHFAHIERPDAVLAAIADLDVATGGIALNAATATVAA